MTKRPSPAEKAARLAARREQGQTGTEPTMEPALVHGDDTIRTKDIRVSLDLKPTLYEALSDWNRGAARALGRGRVTNADVLRSLVRRLLANPELTAAVLADLNQEGRQVR